MLTSIANEVWAAGGEARMGGIRFPTRMVVVRLPSGNLWVHSPVGLTDELATDIDALGPVAHLVAPNIFHHLSMADWKSRYPGATLWAPPGLAKKRPDLTIDRSPERGRTDAWEQAIDTESIEGATGIEEWVFFHRPSASVIVTDLAFHVHHTEHAYTRWMLWLVGVWGKLAQSRLWRIFVTDRHAAARSVQRVMAWPGKRLVMAHGEVIEGETAPLIAQACRWLLRE